MSVPGLRKLHPGYEYSLVYGRTRIQEPVGPGRGRSTILVPDRKAYRFVERAVVEVAQQYVAVGIAGMDDP